jgi:hypothetical protein
VGTNFGLLVHVLPGPNKRRAWKPSMILSLAWGKNSYPSFKLIFFVIRGAHLARSIIENTCWEGLDRISRNFVDVWT